MRGFCAVDKVNATSVGRQKHRLRARARAPTTARPARAPRGVVGVDEHPKLRLARVPAGAGPAVRRRAHEARGL